MNTGRSEQGDEEPRGDGMSQAEHPSQAEGEDRERQDRHPDPRTDGHPSQAEGEDPSRS